MSYLPLQTGVSTWPNVYKYASLSLLSSTFLWVLLHLSAYHPLPTSSPSPSPSSFPLLPPPLRPASLTCLSVPVSTVVYFTTTRCPLKAPAVLCGSLPTHSCFFPLVAAWMSNGGAVGPSLKFLSFSVTSSPPFLLVSFTPHCVSSLFHSTSFPSICYSFFIPLLLLL